MKRAKTRLLVCTTLFASGNIFGDTATTSTSNSLENRIDRVSDQNVFGKWQGKSASASVKEGFTIDAAFLYWQAREDGLEYGTRIKVSTQPAANTPDNPLIASGKTKELDFEWKPGLRVGIGYIFPQEQQWDLSLSWTYIYSKAHDSVTLSGLTQTDTLRPNWTPFLLGSIADQASARWTLHFNTLDLSLGRNYFLGRSVAAKPFIGIRGAWINQNYHQKFSAAHVSGGSVVLPFNSTLKAENDFAGCGLRIGGDLQWLFNSEWSLLGSFSGSLVYGHFKVHEKVKGAIDAGGSLLYENVLLKDNLNQISPDLEGKLGFQWQRFFNDDKYRFSIAAFYDLSYWFFQNQMFSESADIGPDGDTLLSPSRMNGNLQFQGVSLMARFEF